MKRSTVLLVAVLGAAGLVACSSRPPSKASPAASVDRKATAADAGAGDAAAVDGGAPLKPVDESELAESDRSRDPFRSYAQLFAEEARKAVRSQREVVLDQFSLDELKLIGIARSGGVAVAMLVDPTGKGHTVRRGQFVGRPEVVQGAGQGGTPYEINWRVDRIRDGDVVFVREDPRNPDVPTATKVIPLRPEGTVVEQ
jgi:type IV pilus assembly protein PilP